MVVLSPLKIALFTALALVAFAANSVLCRLALGALDIDAASFTAVRLISAALTLLLIVTVIHRGFTRTIWARSGSVKGALALFVYAAAFSFAYVQLSTATGALILFGSVQLTMILTSLVRGQRLHGVEWLGLAIAFTGFVYLVLPGLVTPSVTGFVLMMLSGVAWGFYTLNGRQSSAPILDTAGNFLRAAVLGALLFAPFIDTARITPTGFWLAVASGALASGIGYCLWYAALPALSSIQAGVWQLTVPLIAALGGIVFVGESLSPRLLVAAALLLGGIALVLWGKRQALPA